MKSRAIVGLIALAVLVAVGLYLLVQIPWEFGVFGVLALVGILLAIGVDEPDALGDQAAPAAARREGGVTPERTSRSS